MSQSIRISRLAAVLPILLPIALLAFAPPAHAGKLSRVRAATKSDKKSRSSSSSSYSSDGVSSDDDAVLALYVAASPWWLPHVALGDDYGRKFAYLSHPYAGGHPGFILQDGRDAPRRDGRGRSVLGGGSSLQTSLEGAPIDPQMTRFGLAARLSGSSRFELETRWDLFTEALPSGEVDQLWLGDVTLNWQHAVGRHGQFRTGVGVRAMSDKGEMTYGVNFSYGMDLYPVRPLVIHAGFDVGTVGSATVTQLQATLGLMVGAVEFYAGYDQTWVDDIDLGGPTAGVRLWR